MAQDRDQYLSANEYSLEVGFLTADDSENPRNTGRCPLNAMESYEIPTGLSNRLGVDERKFKLPNRQEGKPSKDNSGSSSESLNYYAAQAESVSIEPTMKEATVGRKSEEGSLLNDRVVRDGIPLLRESCAFHHDDSITKKGPDEHKQAIGDSIREAGGPSVIIDKPEAECSSGTVNSHNTTEHTNNDYTCCSHGIDENKANELGQPQHQKQQHSSNSKPTINKPVLIKIEDCFSATQFLACSSSTRTKATVISTTGIGTNLIADKLSLLEPPAPTPSPTSDSAVCGDDRQLYATGKVSSNRLSLRGGYTMDSLSDNSLERSTNKVASLERRQMQERLRNWKKTNKIITHIRENPFNMHIDCLERLNKKLADDNTVVDDTGQDPPNSPGLQSGPGGIQQNQTPIQHQQLQSYATHLSHLYKKNQAIMDNNTDFRALLYNIICCLLTQDEQILSTPSVTKMIDVIRTHLESASKFYSTATLSFNNNRGLLVGHSNLGSMANINRKSSLDSLSLTSSSSSTFNATSSTPGPSGVVIQPVSNDHSVHQPQMTSDKMVSSVKIDAYHLHPDCSNERRPKPADFRRISSVSYNDEQLINALYDGPGQSSSGMGSNSVAESINKGQESPWLYEELSCKCKHYGHHNTSQSSLENNSSTKELMHDSGIGTIYDFQFDEFLSMRAGNRKRHSDVGEFKPKQQPSYISTDDYLSQLPDESNRTSFYDDESYSTLQRRELQENRPVDVANRRAELERTLNKLINSEVKYMWLTGNDTLRRAIHKIGVPNEIRGKVWLILIEQMIGTKYEITKLLADASDTIAQEEESVGDEEIQSILKQINLDVNRTMPGHKLFDDGAEGGIKLRRILVAYSIHINRAIAYCQGFNFIVALLLSVFEGDEEKALSGFVCIVDHIFPSKFYFDHYLTGARADQFLLADFICDQLIKNPTTAERKIVEGVTSSITLNWFISLFHGAVPTLVTPPSSCDIFATIRNTAKDMYDIKLLLSIVEQIKLPKDSYFAIRRSFYMVQSSFNSDQFYMQSLSNDTSRQLVSNKPLSVQHMPDTKPPAMSLIMGASFAAQNPFGVNTGSNLQNNNFNGRGCSGPRICTSADRTKVCIQNIGKLGRSHIKIMDANNRSNERSLMNPLRNCLVIGISNCGKNIIVARQSSKRNFKTFREQDLLFNVHELCAEIFDGFYLEDRKLALISTHVGEIFKIEVSKCFTDSQVGSTETITLRDSHSIGEHEKLKLRLASMDTLTNLLWIYVECEDAAAQNRERKSIDYQDCPHSNIAKTLYRNNPFMYDDDDSTQFGIDAQSRSNHLVKKILIIDIISFDIFSAFTLHQSFGDIMSMRTSLVAFCQLANPMSNQFSSRIVRIGPTGHYEHLLSFSDVVDFMISVPELHREGEKVTDASQNKKSSTVSQKYATIKRLLPRSLSLNHENIEDKAQQASAEQSDDLSKSEVPGSGTLTKYYRSLMRRHSTVNEIVEQSELNNGQSSLQNELDESKSNNGAQPTAPRDDTPRRHTHDRPCRGIMTSYLGEVEDVSESNYTPVTMVFIFRNGKIALFEFTESYAIHTRESQLDRYDYSKVIDVTKNSGDFVVTILTIFDKLIKVVI